MEGQFEKKKFLTQIILYIPAKNWFFKTYQNNGSNNENDVPFRVRIVSDDDIDEHRHKDHCAREEHGEHSSHEVGVLPRQHWACFEEATRCET